MDFATPLKGVLDDEGRLIRYPAKRKKKLYALFLLASKFEPNREYIEKEVNELINEHTLFNDPATLRRELYDYGFIDRDKACSIYKKSTSQPDPIALGLE